MSNTAQPTKSKPVPKNKLTFVFHDLFDAPISGLEYMVMADEDILDHGKTNDTGETKTISPLTGRLVGIFVKKSADEFKLITSINVPYGKNAIILRSPKMLLGFSTFLHQDTAGDYKPHGHVVKEGETIESVAHAKQTDEKELKKVNKVTHGTKVPAGKVLKVPGKKHSATSSAQESKKEESAATPKNPSADSSASSATQASPSPEQQSQPSQDAGATTSGASQESNTSNGVPGMASIAAAASTASGGSVTAPADKSVQTSTTEGNSGSAETNSGVVNDQPSNTAAKPADTTKTSADSGETKPEQDKTIADRQQAGKQVATEITKPQEKGFDDKGKPVTTIGHLCQNQDACIKKGSPPSELILELNIRLAGFGGALPTNEFTELTENCVKQFQRDYMQIQGTGRVCGSTLAALDVFMNKYSIEPYFASMMCGCVRHNVHGGCQGWGTQNYKIPIGEKPKKENGRVVMKDGKPVMEPPTSYVLERYGMHRSTIWTLRAAMFYMEKESHLGYKLHAVTSGFRCHIYCDSVPELKGHYGNHIGNALDIQFTKNNIFTRGTPDMEQIREEIFVKHIHGIIEPRTGDPRPRNKLWLEPTKFNDGKVAAPHWVHFDVSSFEEIYHKGNLYARSAGVADGERICDIARRHNPSMLLCGGNGGIQPTKNVPEIKVRKDPNELFMSDKAKDFVRGCESYSSFYYNDPIGLATGGIGHLVKGRKSCQEIGVKEYDAIPQEIIDDWWNQDVKRAEIAVRNLKVPLYQYEFDALCSLAWSFTDIPRKAPKLYANLQEKKYPEAASEFLNIVKAGGEILPGLVNRRNGEYNIFMHNSYAIKKMQILTRQQVEALNHRKHK